MPRDKELRSTLILGAAPIVIGQACELDHSGTRACPHTQGGITAEQVCRIGMGRPNVGDAISNEEVMGLVAGAARLARLELGRTKCTNKDFGHIEFVTLRY